MTVVIAHAHEDYDAARDNGNLCRDDFDTDYGMISFYNRCDTTDIDVVRQVVSYIERGGEYTTGLPDDVFQKYHNPKAVWLDAGGHIGGFCIRWAMQFGVAKIHSYEAMYENYTFLAKNARLNDMRDIVTAYNAAIVGGDDEEVTLYVSGVKKRSSTGIHSLIKKRGRTGVVVPAVNIDYAIDTHGVTCAKLDVEGEEYNILTQSTRLMDMEMLIVEYHFNQIRDDIGFPKYWEIVDMLKDNYGYVKYLENPNKPWHYHIVACNRR